MVSRTRAGDAESAPLPLVQEVVDLWVQMQARLQAHFAALAAEHSLSMMQAKVLMQLDTSSAVTMRALADRLQYDPSNLTSVIDHMEALGAIQRRPDPRDRRVKGLTLTAAGAQIRERFGYVFGPVADTTKIGFYKPVLEPHVIDGPFTEAKEVFGGYYVLDAADIDEAIDAAARIPAARMEGSVEVRPVVEL